MLLSRQSYWLAVLLLSACILTTGRMPLWSQNSEPNLLSSSGTMLTWDNLSVKFRTELTGLQNDYQTALREALNEAQLSRNSLMKLTNLYESSLARTQNLENLVDQIGERMQERDEDLAWAYGELDAKDLTIAEKDKTIWKQRAVIIGMGAVIAGAITFMIIKFYFKRKIPIGII